MNWELALRAHDWEINLCQEGRGRKKAARPCSPGHLLQGQFTITCQSTGCLGFLEENFIPSRYSVSSTLHYPWRMSFSCRRAWNHHWSAAPAPGAGCCRFVMRFFLFGLLFLPNLRFQTFTPLCHQRLFFDFLVAVSTGVSISSPALEITLECLFPEPSQSPLVPLSHSVWQNNPCPQTQTTLLPPHTRVLACALSLLRWLSTEPAGGLPGLVFGEGCWFSGGYSESQVEGGNTCWFCWSWAAVGQDIARRSPGMVLVLVRLRAVDNVWTEPDPGLGYWETGEQREGNCICSWMRASTFLYPLFALTKGNRGFLPHASAFVGEFRTYLQDHMLYSIGFFF